MLQIRPMDFNGGISIRKTLLGENTRISNAVLHKCYYVDTGCVKVVLPSAVHTWKSITVDICDVSLKSERICFHLNVTLRRSLGRTKMKLQNRRRCRMILLRAHQFLSIFQQFEKCDVIKNPR